MFDQQEPGILSGIEVLDDMTYGFRAGQLIVVGARPGDGKSSIATQICTKSAKEGHETHILSLEVTKDVCLKKMICSAAKIGYQDVLRGRITPEDKKKLLHIQDRFKKLPLRIDDASSCWTLQKIRNHVKRWQAKGTPIRLLMIDYLQLMPLSRSKSRERHDLAIGEMTSGLKQICNEFGLTIILLSQLSREGEKQNRVPQKSDLRDSGSIESDADTIIMIWHEKKDDTPEKYARRALLIVEKQREGATGNVEALFLKPITTFAGRDYFDRQKAA
jgi:replicative DNA helicase